MLCRLFALLKPVCWTLHTACASYSCPETVAHNQAWVQVIYVSQGCCATACCALTCLAESATECKTQVGLFTGCTVILSLVPECCTVTSAADATKQKCIPSSRSVFRLRSWASSMMTLLYLVSRKSSCSSRSRIPSVMNLRAVSLLTLRSYLTCSKAHVLKPQSLIS